jgi:hypothetical protein
MQFIRRFRLPALSCALAVLLCELVSRPYTTMGISDDGPYILVAQKLAATGHIVYNGWSAAMLGWQLYLGSALIKLFGFSFTTVRMSTLLVAMALAVVLQRTLVHSGSNERNATIGTLALVLSPLYLLMSVTFMSDIHGLFAIVLCLYGCLRALQSSTTRASIGWLGFAVASNAVCGTSRQLAWLGVLVMVPSVLWLLRTRRRVLLAGIAFNLVGVLFIFACMLWLRRQPYTTPGDLLATSFSAGHVLSQFIPFFLDVPFLLLPIAALFLPEIRKSRPRVIAVMVVFCLVYVRLAIRRAYLPLLEPTTGDWINTYGGYTYLAKGMQPTFLHTGMRILLTIASFGGLAGLITSFFPSREVPRAPDPAAVISWKQLGWLLAPYSVAYTLLLTFRAMTIYGLFDRYALALLVVPLICLIRYYQDRVQPRIPLAGILLVGVMAIYGIAITHNTFAFYRARVAIATELHGLGVPDTSIDNGWEYNIDVELQHADYINNPNIVFPVHAYVPTPPLPVSNCPTWWYDETPHIHPVYGISFDPGACYGPAPFAPVHYSRWLASKPGTLYVVKYTGPSRP